MIHLQFNMKITVLNLIDIYYQNGINKIYKPSTNKIAHKNHSNLTRKLERNSLLLNFPIALY